jgi:hypothetical protein
MCLVVWRIRRQTSPIVIRNDENDGPAPPRTALRSVGGWRARPAAHARARAHRRPTRSSMTKRRRDDATNPGTSPGPRFPGGVVPPPAGSTMREDLATNATTTTTTTTAGGDGADGDANAALANGETNEPFMPPAKAPPLRAEDIPGLNTAERRLVLSRWNSRLRALKNRARDISYQFPTSNVMVFLSKPFPTERRHGWWCVSHETLETQSGKDESFFNEATASASARTE